MVSKPILGGSTADVTDGGSEGASVTSHSTTRRTSRHRLPLARYHLHTLTPAALHLAHRHSGTTPSCPSSASN